MSEKIMRPIQRIGAELFDAKGHLLARGWREDWLDETCRYVNSHDALLDACKAFIFRWARSGPSGSAQWEKFDKVVNDIDAAILLAKKEG